MTLKCDLDLESAHCFTERNVWMKLNEYRPKGSSDIQRTHNSRVHVNP